MARGMFQRGVCMLGWLCMVTAFNTSSPLHKLGLETDVTISGLSGGAFFAAQFHVAYSSIVNGMAALAGGPFYCAMDDVLVAEGRCMRFPNDISVQELIDFTELTYDESRTIDNPDNLKDDRVWMLSPEEDTVVATGVVQKLQEYYEHYLTEPSSQLRAVYNQTGEHAFLTQDQGSECTYKGKPFINACGYDAAGELLQHLFDNSLHVPNGSDPDGLKSGSIQSFSQRLYIDELYTNEEAALGLTGYVYVPDQCSSGEATCKLHVSFHGCEQTVWDIGQEFVTMTGYNQWAAANDMVILYPQAMRTALNPKGCFDWWGYTGVDYACKLGVQMQAVHNMILAL